MQVCSLSRMGRMRHAYKCRAEGVLLASVGRVKSDGDERALDTASAGEVAVQQWLGYGRMHAVDDVTVSFVAYTYIGGEWGEGGNELSSRHWHWHWHTLAHWHTGTGTGGRIGTWYSASVERPGGTSHILRPCCAP